MVNDRTSIALGGSFCGRGNTNSKLIKWRYSEIAGIDFFPLLL